MLAADSHGMVAAPAALHLVECLQQKPTLARPPYYGDSHTLSAWRREALNRFPERLAEIKHAVSLFDVLSLLEQDLRATYRGDRSEPDLADRVFEFAAWGFDKRRAKSVQNAVAVGFYEHLPDSPPGRADLARRLSFETLWDLEGLFRKMNTKQSYDELQREIVRVHGRPLVEASRNAAS